jgi:hypothetical protein
VKKAAVVTAALIILLVGGAFVGLPVVEKNAALELRAEMERSGEVKVGAVEVGLLGRRVVLSDLAITGGPGADFELTAAHLDVQGLSWPLAELLHGRTPFSGFRWGDPLRAGRIEARDVRLADRAAMTDWHAMSIVAEDIDLARFDGDIVGRDPGIALPARALAALTVRRLEQRDVSFASTVDGQTLGLGSVVVERFDRGLIANFAVGDFKVGAKGLPTAALDIHEISAVGLDLRRPLDELASGTRRLGQPLGRLWAERFVIAGLGGLALSPYGISLERMTTEQRHESNTVILSRTRIDGLVINPPSGSAKATEIRTGLEAIGVSELKLAVDCSAREDRGAGVLKIENCAMTSPDLAEIGLGMTVVGIDGNFWRALDEGNFSHVSTSKAALGAAELVIADKSLLERTLKAVARNTGTPVMLLRPLAALQIRKYQPPGVLITDSLTKLLDTIARFVEQGGTLTLTAHPEPPFAFSRADYLLTPGPDLVSVFGLSATLSK